MCFAAECKKMNQLILNDKSSYLRDRALLSSQVKWYDQLKHLYFISTLAVYGGGNNTASILLLSNSDKVVNNSFILSVTNNSLKWKRAVE